MPHQLRQNFENKLGNVDLNDLSDNEIARGRNKTIHTDIKKIREGRLSGQFWAVIIQHRFQKTYIQQ